MCCLSQLKSWLTHELRPFQLLIFVFASMKPTTLPYYCCVILCGISTVHTHFYCYVPCTNELRLSWLSSSIQLIIWMWHIRLQLNEWADKLLNMIGPLFWVEWEWTSGQSLTSCMQVCINVIVVTKVSFHYCSLILGRILTITPWVARQPECLWQPLPL